MLILRNPKTHKTPQKPTKTHRTLLMHIHADSEKSQNPQKPTKTLLMHIHADSEKSQNSTETHMLILGIGRGVGTDLPVG
jgi:hypothetical protein